MDDHGLEQLVQFLTREKNTLDLIPTFHPGWFQEIHSPDRLSDHDVISGTLKKYIPSLSPPPPPKKKKKKKEKKKRKKETSEESVFCTKGKF